MPNKKLTLGLSLLVAGSALAQTYNTHGAGLHFGSRSYTADQSISSDKLIDTAKSFRGVRYRWGAASRGATDCSGLILQVYRAAGIKLPRTSSAQSWMGKPVSRKDLKPGDLIFFHTLRGTRVSHVGMYIGHNKFIHASSGGGHVMVSSLGQAYYSHRFVCARRIAEFKPGEIEKITSDPASPVASDPGQIDAGDTVK